MKWLVFACVAAAVFPLAGFLREDRRRCVYVWTLIGFLPFTGLDFLRISFVAVPEYRGSPRGLEIMAIDLLAAVLYLTLPPSPSRSPFAISRWAYLAVAVFSVTQAVSWLLASFAVSQVIRMYVLLGAIHRGADDRRMPMALLTGAMLGMVFEAGVVLSQRYVFGINQTRGWFAHQNSLGMTVNLFLPVAVVMVLRGIGGWLPVAASVGGAIAVILSLSRGAIGAAVVGIALMVVLSVLKRFTSRKAVILVVGTVIAAGLAMKAQDTIAHRFAKAADASWSSRVRANDAVFLMLQDHPAGVGINHFALVNEQGRYEERANGAPVPDWDLIGIVHNIYLLTLAEMGYVGLLAFLALILVPLWTAFRAGWRGSPTLRGELLLGLGVGLLAMSLMGLLEWGWRQTAVAYLYWIAVGLVGVLSRQQAHGTGRSPRVSRPRPESTTPPAGRPLTSSAGRWRPSSPANRR